MERCSLCEGRLLQTDQGHRCMNDNCVNSKEAQKPRYVCESCKEPLIFKRNTPYGDPIYICPDCKLEVRVG